MGKIFYLPTVNTKSRGVMEHIVKGSAGLCPRCGKGHVFEKGINVAEVCPACQLALDKHELGITPQFAVSFILTAALFGLALWMEATYHPDFYTFVWIMVPVAFAATFLMLRPFKGIIIALQYRYRSEHSR